MATCARDILNALVIEPADEAGRPRAPVPEKDPAPGAGDAAPFAKREPVPKEARGQRLAVPANLGKREEAVCRALLAGESDFDALCEATGIDSGEMGALLSDMELDGLVTAVSGLVYAPGEAMRGP